MSIKNPSLEAAEITQILEDFVNEHGLWNEFKEWLSEKGYQMEQLGMEDDE